MCICTRAYMYIFVCIYTRFLNPALYNKVIRDDNVLAGGIVRFHRSSRPPLERARKRV